MATPTLGQLQPFNSDTDSITAYIERVHLFFAANDIPDKKKVPVFLSTIGGSTYELLRNLVSPELPESLKLSELTEVLKRHFEPKPLVIAERFHFHSRSQAADESVADFMAQLRRLSKHCDFQDYLDQALRDRLVCGLRNEGIQRRLLAESDLTLTRALELAQGMEAAEKNAKSLKGTVPAVHNVNTGVKRPQCSQRATDAAVQIMKQKTVVFAMLSAISAIKRGISRPFADRRNKASPNTSPSKVAPYEVCDDRR